ncbi:MAG: HEAT repeat domain-containing protein [Blastocatellia bacterium]
MNKKYGRGQSGSVLLITCLLTTSWAAVSRPVQPAIAPVAIPKQCESLTTGSPEDAIAHDLASLALPQSEAKTEETLRQLAGSCDTRAVMALIARLGASSLSTRLAAIDGLGRLGGQESAEALLEQLSDPTPQIRLALIPAMVAFPESRMRINVLNLIARGNPQEIETPEKAALTGVAMLTLNQLIDTSFNRKAILFQFELEQAGIPAIQPTVASSMSGLTKTRNGVRELIGILKKHNAPVIRVWAATWLGKLRVEEAREALQNTAANDQNSGVKDAAAAALRELDQPRVQ